MEICTLFFVCLFVVLVGVRLSDGVSPNQGRVEVFDEGEWQTMCGLGWGNAEATVVCRLLGFPPATGTTSQSSFGAGSLSLWLHEFSCDGTEQHLTECPMDTVVPFEDMWFFCDSSTEVGVVCGTPNGRHYFLFLSY